MASELPTVTILEAFLVYHLALKSLIYENLQIYPEKLQISARFDRLINRILCACRIIFSDFTLRLRSLQGFSAGRHCNPSAPRHDKRGVASG